jgi:hypothetical protein
MDSKKTFDYVKIAAIVIGGYYVLKTIKGVGSGVADVFSEDPGEDGSSQGEPGKPANLSHEKFVYKTAADTIQSAIWDQSPFALWEDDTAIADSLLIAYNIDDVKQLTFEYGVRGANDALSARENLPQAISNHLDADLKREVNDEYIRRGIDFAWL